MELIESYSIDNLRLLAIKGNVKAQYDLGNYYLYHYIEKDNKKAIYW
jgi:TPR repeat protein